MSTTRTRPAKAKTVKTKTSKSETDSAPSTAQPGHRPSADATEVKKPASISVLMKLADLRTTVAGADASQGATAEHQGPTSPLQATSDPSAEQPADESPEPAQMPRRADRPAAPARNVRRQRRDREPKSTAAGWIRPAWQVAMGSALVLMFFVAYLVLINRRSGSDSSNAPDAAGQLAASPVTIELPPGYSTASNEQSSDAVQRNSPAADPNMQLQVPQLSNQPLQISNDTAAKAPRIDAPLAERPPLKPDHLKQVQQQPQTQPPHASQSPRDSGSYYETPQFAREQAAAPQYTYPVTDPSTYLYPAGSDSSGQPGVATLRGTIEQPPTRSR